MDVAERFAENLVRRRERAGLSQEELAALSSLHRTQIGLMERGKRLPRIDTLVKLAGGLSVSPSELLKGIRWEAGSSTPGGFSIADEGPGSD